MITQQGTKRWQVGKQQYISFNHAFKNKAINHIDIFVE